MSEDSWGGWRDLGLCEQCGRMIARGEHWREREGRAFPEETAHWDEAVLRSHRDHCAGNRVLIYSQALKGSG